MTRTPAARLLVWKSRSTSTLPGSTLLPGLGVFEEGLDVSWHDYRQLWPNKTMHISPEPCIAWPHHLVPPEMRIFLPASSVFSYTVTWDGEIQAFIGARRMGRSLGKPYLTTHTLPNLKHLGPSLGCKVSGGETCRPSTNYSHPLLFSGQANDV